MHKLIEFYLDGGIDILKLGCTQPNLGNICLHKSIGYMYYPIFSSDSDLLEELRETMIDGPSIVFTTKAVANETSNNLCKSIVGISSNQIYPYSMYQDMPTGLYTKWDYNEETQKFEVRQNRVQTFEIMVVSQATRSECTKDSCYTSGVKEKLVASVMMVFATIVRLFLKQWEVISTLSLSRSKI